MNVAAHGSARLTNQEGTWVLALGGEHDLSTLQQLEQRMNQVCGTSASVVVDLTSASVIDGRVVGWLPNWSDPSSSESSTCSGPPRQSRAMQPRPKPHILGVLPSSTNAGKHALSAHAGEDA